MIKFKCHVWNICKVLVLVVCLLSRKEPKPRFCSDKTENPHNLISAIIYLVLYKYSFGLKQMRIPHTPLLSIILLFA